ncbi:MFS transporter [Lacisediminihabitans profunda]|uniref:MFS transporter n=2 Tax=Lacisediminihabitans profunda TaxID=2594790 RepID=A0A5C8UST7_9MICO|nr:MFS transporter [Lacisediminihabitans profunda]
MQTLVTPIIPHLPALLDTTAADSTWVLTSTLLAAAISTPISGRLGDMYGKRRIVLVLLIIMAGGSIVSALSNTLIPMIVGRVLQGVGLGVISLGISILRDVIHPKNLGGAVALVSATLGVGGAVGLPVAAVIAQNFDYHYLFWLALLLAVVAIVLVGTIVPVSTLRAGGRFDFVGAVGFAVGLVGILLAVSKGNEWGWTSPVTLSLLIGGIAVLLIWGAVELRMTDPLIDLRVAARRPVLLTNLASISVGFAFFITTAALPVLLEAPTTTGVGLGQSLLVSSLCLMPLGLIMFFLSPVAARLSNARGPRTSLILGGAIITAAFALAVWLHGAIWHVILISAIVGVGVGFAYAAMPTLIMRAVPPNETAAANGLNSVMRTLGSTVAATLVGVILSSHLVLDGGIGIPTTQAFQLVFAMGAGVALTGVIIGAFIPTRGTGFPGTASIPIQRA